jgi:hypothetical protein
MKEKEIVKGGITTKRMKKLEAKTVLEQDSGVTVKTKNVPFFINFPNL